MAETDGADNGAVEQRNRMPLAAVLAPMQTAGGEQSTGGNAEAAPSALPKKNLGPLDKTIFRVQQGQWLTVAAEIPGGIEGVADEDAYLFVTADFGTMRNPRVWLVPKNDPAKQQEIKDVDAEFDTDNKEIRIDLGPRP